MTALKVIYRALTDRGSPSGGAIGMAGEPVVRIAAIGDTIARGFPHDDLVAARLALRSQS